MNDIQEDTQIDEPFDEIVRYDDGSYNRVRGVYHTRYSGRVTSHWTTIYSSVVVKQADIAEVTDIIAPKLTKKNKKAEIIDIQYKLFEL